jgi:hypothetical protein
MRFYRSHSQTGRGSLGNQRQYLRRSYAFGYCPNFGLATRLPEGALHQSPPGALGKIPSHTKEVRPVQLHRSATLAGSTRLNASRVLPNCRVRSGNPQYRSMKEQYLMVAHTLALAAPRCSSYRGIRALAKVIYQIVPHQNRAFKLN